MVFHGNFVLKLIFALTLRGLQIDELEVSKLKAELVRRKAAGGGGNGQQSFGASQHPRASVEQSRYLPLKLFMGEVSRVCIYDVALASQWKRVPYGLWRANFTLNGGEIFALFIERLN